MGDYVTEATLRERFPDAEISQLIDRAKSNGDYVLDGAIKGAESKVNMRLASRYKTPLNPAPYEIVEITHQIVRWMLYGDDVTEEVQMRYEDAVSELDNIARGLLQIASGTVEAGAQPGFAVEAPEQFFTAEQRSKIF